MKTSEFIFKIAGGLFFSIIYLAISYLASYLSVYWEWKWGVGTVWFIIGVITYSILFEQEVNTAVNVFGVILNIGILIFCNYYKFKLEPKLWIYIVLNTIVCLNIITTCVKKH